MPSSEYDRLDEYLTTTITYGQNPRTLNYRFRQKEPVIKSFNVATIVASFFLLL
jgi:hypothetical protein